MLQAGYPTITPHGRGTQRHGQKPEFFEHTEKFCESSQIFLYIQKAFYIGLQLCFPISGLFTHSFNYVYPNCFTNIQFEPLKKMNLILRITE